MSVVVLGKHNCLEALVFGPVPQAHSCVIRALVVVNADEKVSLSLLPSGPHRTKFNFSYLVLVSD